ncbi:MAG TPA: SAM-dependent methyltransferase, partial [Streptosporangiaceae bacterium]|nr:SAM-dependent methyltransferase [Streptosporangiaceae bacterium]
MTDRPFRADVARSARLFRAFRTEQSAPAAYYTALARDTISQLSQYTRLPGRVVADVGGGPGFFIRELRGAGARAVCVDTSSGELPALGRAEAGSAV